ncbi:MAG: methionine adenosyltransferase [Nitrococcus sp.]|nr:methionine adenosyltransferase [Nitrococcus sp.]
MKKDFVFTSESVTEGHPDKLCDQISDAVVDEFLQQDPYARIIAECAVSKGVLFIAARFAANAAVNIPEIARRVIHDVGYQDKRFNARDCTIMTSFSEQPLNDKDRVNEYALSHAELERRLVCQNQVTVFGYACDQTPALMPLPIALAQRLSRRMAAARLAGDIPYLSPDGKTQVGIEYRAGNAHRIHSITLIASQQARECADLVNLRRDLIRYVIEPVLAEAGMPADENTAMFINPDGPLIGGGPSLHSGLTGRKNAIDTYGEYVRHSGAALSGKDPMRIDRVGAYAARHAAKNVVAAGLASQCEIQLSYSIGQAGPVSMVVETFGSGNVDDREIAERLRAALDFRLGAIMARFNLRGLPGMAEGGFYRKLAAYGHVGRADMDLPWERTEVAAAMRLQFDSAD